MEFKFELNFKNEKEFLDYWGSVYLYSDPEHLKEIKYTENINKPLTEESRRLLYEWKNGGKISNLKMQSIKKNYPLILEDDVDIKDRYLNPDQSGGPIWNIFYIHLLYPSVWPIFDQHVYRAMMYIKKQVLEEIPKKPAEIFTSYINVYIPFVREFNEKSYKRVDEALYSFGQFLSKVKKLN
jgi:hypothetical protein